MMKDNTLSVLLFVFIALIAACTGNKQYHAAGQNVVGTPCKVNSPCGQKILISSNTQNISTVSRPNVCKTTRIYKQAHYLGVYKAKCHWHGYYCKVKCVPTDICGMNKTVQLIEYHCCAGYTIALRVKNSFLYYIFRNSKHYLKQYGCPTVLHNTVIDCIEKNGLYVMTDLFNSTELGKKLRNGSSPTKYTLFAVPNELLVSSQIANLPLEQLVTALGTHVITREVHSVLLLDDSSFHTASKDIFIHVSKYKPYTYSWLMRNLTEKTYINSIELLAGDACFAINGVVHVVSGVFPTSNSTIAEIIRSSPDLSLMASLLQAAGLFSALNVPSTSKTFFAVTNKAFIKGNTDTGVDIAQCLLAKNNDKMNLKKFLRYHMTKGAEYEIVLMQKSSLATESCSWVFQGANCYFKCEELVVTVNDDGIGIGKTGSMITKPDVPASNGVIQYLSLPLIEPTIDITQLCAGFPYNATVN